MNLIDKIINNGLIYIDDNFLPKDIFDDLFLKIKNNELYFEPTFQPKGYEYGNRFQAFPCYESYYLQIIDEKINNFIKTKIENLLNVETYDFRCAFRKVIIDELKKSKIDTKYGLIHKDDGDNIAGIISFNQTVDGGTAFFNYMWDKKPDITIGSKPNRFILYNAQRPHSTSTDFTYDERINLTIFAKVRERSLKMEKKDDR
jgi:hypothetical protein